MAFSDTSREARQIQIEIFRRLGPEGRLDKALELAELSRQLLTEGVRLRHPEYSADEVRLAVIRLQLPEELFRAAYPEALGVKP